MAIGRNPQFYGETKVFEVLNNSEVLAKFPFLATVKNKISEPIQRMLVLNNIFKSPAGRKLFRELVGMSDEELTAFQQQFWDEFDLHDRDALDTEIAVRQHRERFGGHTPKVLQDELDGRIKGYRKGKHIFLLNNEGEQL